MITSCCHLTSLVSLMLAFSNKVATNLSPSQKEIPKANQSRTRLQESSNREGACASRPAWMHPLVKLSWLYSDWIEIRTSPRIPGQGYLLRSVLVHGLLQIGILGTDRFDSCFSTVTSRQVFQFRLVGFGQKSIAEKGRLLLHLLHCPFHPHDSIPS